MALIYLLSGLALGAALVRRVPFPLYRFEAVAMAVVLGLFTWTWVALAASLVMPYDVALPLVVTAATGVTFALWRTDRPAWRPLEGGRRAWAVWGVATAATTALLARLFWTHSLPRDSEGVWSVAASWADYGLHAGIITHLAGAASIPGDLPIASGEKLTYPFLIDFLSALYVQGGMSLSGSLLWPGLLLGLAITQLMISFGLRLFGRISVGVGGMALALMIGSAGGVAKAWSDWRESGQGLFAFLGKLPDDYTLVKDSNANVTNLLVDGILPQRGILFGLGVGLVVFILLHTAREREETKLLWPAAVLIGLLPMAHAHTFMVGMGLLLSLAAEAAWRSRSIGKAKAFLWPVAVALIVALPQLLWQQSANGRGTGGRFRFAWQWQSDDSLLGYWWANFGLVGLALLIMPFVLRRHRQVFWLLPMLAILAVSQLYVFQPFEYDNLKLIWWVFIVGGFFIAYLAGELIRRHRAWLVAVVPLGLFVVTPGALAITQELQDRVRYQFATNDDVAVAEWARVNTPPDAVFVAIDQANVPVLTLGGRTLMIGYRGWLFNFNIPSEERDLAGRAAFAGRFDDPLLRKFGADYALIPTVPNQTWPVDEAALQQRTPVYTNTSWRVYKLEG